jgi:hypothetical protein
VVNEAGLCRLEHTAGVAVPRVLDADAPP